MLRFIQIALNSMQSAFSRFSSQSWVLIIVLVSNSYSYGATLKEVLNSEAVQKLQKKWEELEIKGSLDLSKDANFGKNGYLSGDIGYKLNVQPALTSGLHQRVDTYFVGASVGAEDLLNLGLQGHVQVSFSKLHLLKKSAILQRPTSIRKFPFNSQDALDELNIGEAARIEISSAAILAANFLSELMQSNFVSLKAAYERGNNTFVEVYRLKDDFFRVRFVTSKNTGEVSTGVTLKPYIDFGLLDNIINGLLSCKPLDINKSQGIGQLPLDTMIADYIIDLKDPAARQVYDSAFNRISLMDLRRQFVSLKKQTDFSSGFWTGFSAFDEYYRSQNLFAETPQAIKRTFKGRMLSEQLLINKSSACFKLWDLRGKEGHSVSSIRVYDFQENFMDLFYMRTQNETGKSFIKRDLNAKGQRDFEMLFNASRDIPTDPASVRLGILTDFVMTNEQEERQLTAKEMGLLLADFKYQYGVYDSQIDINGLLAVLQNKDELVQKVRVWVDPHQMRKLPVLTAEEYQNLVALYVYQHPVRSMIPTSINPKNPIYWGVNPYKSDIEKIAAGLARALDPSTSVVDFYKEFRNLRKNKMYQFISAGLLISLFPPELRKESIQFNYTLEQDGTVIYTYSSADFQNTDNFKNISGIVTTLQDRSFDVSTQIKALQ